MTEYEAGVVQGLTVIGQQLGEVTLRLSRVVDKLGHQIAKADQLIEQQAAIAQGLEDLKDLQAASMAMSSALIDEAKEKMAQQEAEVAAAREAIQAPIPMDVYPFEAVPAGTQSRTLPDGGKLFTLADGSAIRCGADGGLLAVMASGESAALSVARDRYVRLPDGRSLRLVTQAVRATHEAAGISGLPIDVEPELVAEGRYRINLPGGFRLELSQADRRLLVINPVGTAVLLSPSRLEGIGERLAVRIIAGGVRAFHAEESNHRGVVETDGTIYLTLPDGRDLVVRFPEATDDAGPVPAPKTFNCQGRYG
jgi:hypothetical protein